MINYLNKFSLKNKTIYITGGGGLIGTEVSKAIASAGAKVIIMDVDVKKGKSLEKTIQKKKYKAKFEYFDITDLENLDENFKALIKRYRRIDAWINIAYPRTKDWGNKVEDITLESWRKNVDIHMNGYSWTSRLAAMAMKKLKVKGVIINFGSTYGVQANDFTVYDGTNMTSPMAYAAIKGGIINLTRYIASYFGEYGIRVNNICPGGIFDNQNKIFVRNYEKKVPLKRMGKPEDIASAVLFLVSDAAGYITGETLIVDGGWTIV